MPLGVLSSRIHTNYALAAGSWLGVGNDPRWRNTTCFEPFPFPDATEPQKARIRDLAERLDAHRKAVQAAVPDATLTAQYNALERVRALKDGQAPLSPTERTFHESARIGVLNDLHDDLDAAVAEAYGFPLDLTDDQILERLVSLNAARAAEEEAGTVRWLRPALQAPTASAPTTDGDLGLADTGARAVAPANAAPGKRPLPDDEHERLKALRDLFAEAPGPLSLVDVKNAFAFARLESVRPGVELLESFGMLVGEGDGDERRWRGRVG